MGDKALDSATFLALADEFQRIQEASKSGLALIVEFSSAALKATGRLKDEMGVREIVEEAKPLLRDFFSVLRASAGLAGVLRVEEELPQGSSER